MEYEDGRVTIIECPCCGSNHNYDVHMVHKVMQAGISDGYELDEVSSTIEAKFHCPIKREDFEDTVTVVHRYYEMLRELHTRLAKD